MKQTLITRFFNSILVLLGFSSAVSCSTFDEPGVAEKTEEIEVVRVKKGDGEWYLGKYEAKGVVIGLEKKQ